MEGKDCEMIPCVAFKWVGRRWRTGNTPIAKLHLLSCLCRVHEKFPQVNQPEESSSQHWQARSAMKMLFASPGGSAIPGTLYPGT